MSLQLLAQAARHESLTHAREWFLRDNPMIWKQIATVVMVVGVVILLVWILARWQSRIHGGCSPMRLYLRMQKRMGMSWADRWRLWRLARLLSVEHPTALLISPALFDEALDRYRQGARDANDSASKKAFIAIRARLFPGPAGTRRETASQCSDSC